MKKHNKHDPSEIVIDEVVGQMLTSALTMISIVFVYNSELGKHYTSEMIDFTCFFLLPFVLFRACDIIKPWPINWMDKNIKGGVGVMLDDIAAAFMASVLQYAIIFAAIGYTKSHF
jgi:phosphatidylglycerophosphatase A